MKYVWVTNLSMVLPLRALVGSDSSPNWCEAPSCSYRNYGSYDYWFFTIVGAKCGSLTRYSYKQKCR